MSRPACGLPSSAFQFDFECLAEIVFPRTDPVIAAGLTAVLQEHAGFKIVPTQEAGSNIGCGSPAADVILADYETALRLAEGAPQWAKNLVVFGRDFVEKGCCFCSPAEPNVATVRVSAGKPVQNSCQALFACSF